MLQLFEAHAGVLTQEQFREFALPYYKQILHRVRKDMQSKQLMVPMVHVLSYIFTNSNLIMEIPGRTVCFWFQNVFAKDAHYALRDLSNSGYDVISLDWTIDPSAARQISGTKVTLQGNMDPCALYADPVSKSTELSLATIFETRILQRLLLKYKDVLENVLTYYSSQLNCCFSTGWNQWKSEGYAGKIWSPWIHC